MVRVRADGVRAAAKGPDQMNPVDRNALTQSMLAMRGAVLDRNSALRAAAEATSPSASAAGVERAPQPFAVALSQAVSQVNAAQADASTASAAYERGDTTDVAAVMLARQRASVGFEATLQVRNKLLSAYQDIMNMPL
jgi:flagellar hook-basal body complex protein FliE